MSDVEILEDEDEEPTEEQVLEYAEFLGMDLKKERHLLWIAREGVAAPVPHPWKTCEEKGEVFYFNFDTEESSWDHPCDAHYRALLEEHRAKSTEVEEKDEGTEARNAIGSDVEKEEKAESVSHESFVSEMVESSEVDMERAGIDLKAKASDASSPWSATSTPRSEAGQKEPGKDQSLSAPEAQSDAQSDGKQPGEEIPEVHVVPSAARQGDARERPGIGLAQEAKDREEAFASNSEVSEDFRSDWGAPSPLGSSAPGVPHPAPHSLEVSASDASVLGLGAPHPAVKSWALLGNDLANISKVLDAVQKLQGDHAAFLRRLKG